MKNQKSNPFNGLNIPDSLRTDIGKLTFEKLLGTSKLASSNVDLPLKHSMPVHRPTSKHTTPVIPVDTLQTYFLQVYPKKGE